MEVEEKNTCPKCDKDVNPTSELTCKHCSQTYHISCQKISKTTAKLLKQVQQEGEDENVFWVCGTCRRATANIQSALTVMYSKLEEMETKVDSFVESVKKLARQKKSDKVELKRDVTTEVTSKISSEYSVKLEQITRRMEKLDAEVKEYKNTVENKSVEMDNKMKSFNQQTESKLKNQTSESMINIIKELRNQENRRLNIMVFNMKESDDNSKEKRIEHDIKTFTKLCDDVCDFPVVVCSAQRIGISRNGKPKALKIQLISESQCLKVLQNAWEIGKPTCDRERIFINKDLTPLEQTRRRELVLELKKKKEQSIKNGTGEQWRIKWGKVVRKNNTVPT